MPYYRHMSPIRMPDLACRMAETIFAPEKVDRLHRSAPFVKDHLNRHFTSELERRRFKAAMLRF